jgi:rubrerythrin
MMSARHPQRILGCPICGYRVDTKDRTCPRCGSEFDTGTKFECPLCGGLVDSNARSCPSCHVDYGDFKEKTIARGSDDDIDELLTEIIGIESAQIKQSNKRYSCPKCSWMLDGSESVCPRCNHDLVADLSFQCPMCGSIVGSSAKACPECGVSFEESEMIGAPTPPAKTEPVAEKPRPPPPAPPPVAKPKPEPAKEVKPIVIVKPPPRAQSRPERKPEPPSEPVKHEIDLELETPEPSPSPPKKTPEDELEELEHLEGPGTTDKSPTPPAKPAGQPAKAGPKRRKLKTKPKG